MLTRRRGDEPAPARRRRSGETGRSFYKAAKAVARRIVQLPPQAFAAARFLANTEDWLNFWSQNEAVGDVETCDNLDADRNGLSLRL